MLTKEQVLAAVKAGRKTQCLDSRDYSRLVKYFPVSDFDAFGFSLNEGATHEPTEWTRENILAQLSVDVAFGFEKALDKRGLSAGMMHAVVRMWMWILEDELQYHEEYAQYGLPLLRRVALKYGFDNPIGNDYGNEYKYSEEGDY